MLVRKRGVVFIVEMGRPTAGTSPRRIKERSDTIKTMKTTVLNYRIIIEPDEQTGTGKPGFTAYCPTLKVADDGNTIEETITHIQGAIKAYVDSLIEDSLPVPTDQPEQDIITSTQIQVNGNFQFA